MATLSVLLAIVSVITALLLTIVILIQNPKGQGGIGSISGGVSEAMFGASAPSALVKITVVLAIIFLLSTLFYAAIAGRHREAKSVGESITADYMTTTTEAADAVAAVAEESVEAAKDAAATAESAVKDAAEAAESAVKDAAEAAGNAVKSAADAVKNAAE